MGKQSRRTRAPAPTDMDSVAAKRRVQNQLVYSETELLEVFNSRAVTQFMTGTEDDQRKLVCPVLQERLHSCMPQVSCPPGQLEDLAVKVGHRLNQMELPRMVDLLRGPTVAFVAELQTMFDSLRLGDAILDDDLNERQLLSKWLGKERVAPFLRGRPSERRAELSTIMRCEVLAAHKALGLRYDHEHYEEQNNLVVNYVVEEIFLLDMQDILAMWDGETKKPRERFTAFMIQLAPGAHAFAQRMRKGRAKTETGAQRERAREEAMERIRAFRAYARKRGADFAARAAARAKSDKSKALDWDAINEKKERAAARDRLKHAREAVRADTSLAAIAARSLDEALAMTAEGDHSPEKLERYYEQFGETLAMQGYPVEHIPPLVEILRQKFEDNADTDDTVEQLMACIPRDVALNPERERELPPPPPSSPPDEQASPAAPQQVEDGWVGGLAEAPAPSEPPPGWKPIEWMNTKHYHEMLKAPGAVGDRLRAQVANVMDRAMERGATARDAAMEAEMVATDAAACDREDARVQAKRDKKAKRRARKEKEEQAAKRELAERRKARISRLVDEAEEAEGVGMDDSVEQVHACESPGSSSQHAAAAPSPEGTDPQDDEFCNDMERALQLSAEEATYREVQAVLAEDAAPPTAPTPAPTPERATAECAVCWEVATHLVSPCGHFCLCEACSKNMAQCPICRGDVQAIIKVFVS